VLRIARIVVGVVFLVAGSGKLMLPLIARLRPGTPTFAEVLLAIHVPLPVATGLAVCALEIAGALALLFGRRVRLASLLLAADMIGALVSLSVPATFFGRPVTVGAFTLGNEIWRVPLEATLLVVLAWLAARRDDRALQR
jgi:uncharacterized membrane protein YphA (DoxX/SURF4 family)